MEWRLAQNDVITYEGDLSVPPTERGKPAKQQNGKIRNGVFNGEDEDLYIEDTPQKPSQNYELTAEEEAELGLTD